MILQIGFYRFIDKCKYKEIFGTEFYKDFISEVTYLLKKGIIYEEENSYRWNLAEHEMGHRSFFMHIIQYWYSPVYIKQILKKHL